MKHLKLVCACAALASLQQAGAESTVVSEYPVTEDVEIRVESGDVKRIEYLSGTAAATITKTGGGTLEIGVLGNENFSFVVQEGSLKSVRPQFADLGDSVWFRADASDASSMTFNVQNGTNYVSRWSDADGRDRYVTPYTGLQSPGPFISKVTMNGLATMDFGGLRDTGVYGDPPKGHTDPSAAAFMASETALISEAFYIWQDVEGVKDLPLAIKSDGSETTFVGPTPINTQSCGYRGYGGGGSGFPLWYTAPDRMGTHFYLDDVRRDSKYVPEDGWHLARYTVYNPDWDRSPTSTHLGSYGFLGFGYFNSRYGGCRIAEVVLCTNLLSDAEHTYVDRYLKCKWYLPKVARIVVGDGATLDVTSAKWDIGMLALSGDVVGRENLCAREALAPGRNGLSVSGVYSAPAFAESMTPDLAFVAAGEVSVASGTARGNVVDAQGVFTKSGAGTFELSYFSSNVSELVVAEGVLTLSPLLSAASAVHFDAAQFVTTEEKDGKKLVSNWGDVNGTGTAIDFGEKYKFSTAKSSEKVNLPYLVEDSENGLPVVNFGSFVDTYHQDGWGGALQLTRPLAGGKNAINTYDGWLQGFIVWKDDPGAKDLDLVDGQEFIGPSLFGNNWVWTRGKGGGGNGFPVPGTEAANFKDNQKLDGVALSSAEFLSTRISDGLHLLDIRPANSKTDGPIGVQYVGVRRTTVTESCYGGVNMAEFMFFRYHLSADQRAKIAAALGVKWFGTDKWKLEQVFGSLSVADGASASFPYADVTVTNLAASGSVSARSLTVADGGKLIVDATDRVLTADGVSFAGKGTIVLNADVGPTIDEPIKVIAAANGPATAQKVPGWRTKTGVKAVLVRRADGYYLDPAPGLVLILK